MPITIEDVDRVIAFAYRLGIASEELEADDARAMHKALKEVAADDQKEASS